MKIPTIKNNQGIVLSMLFLFTFFSSLVKAQQWTPTGNGNHTFESQQPPQNLSFYLFDDGYHSFSQNPHHQYKESHKNPVHYSAEPYDDGNDVDELVMTETIDFSTSATPEMTNPDNQVSIKRSWELVENKDNYFIITIENSQYTHAISGCLEFHFSKNKIDVEPAEILDHNHYDNDWVHTRTYSDSDYQDEDFTHKYKWDFDNLQVGEQRYIYVNAECLLEPLKRVKTRAVMKISGSEYDCDSIVEYKPKTDGSNDDISDSHMYTFESIVKNDPHDPNCITAEPYGLYECDYNQTITYKIYFHNDGVDPAENVHLDMDILAPYHDVKLIGASADCYLVWDNNKIDILFNNINLKGLNQVPSPNYIKETYGLVEIDVCYNLADFTLNNLTCAQAHVDIIFDLETPISVSNRICRNIDCTTGLTNFNTYVGYIDQNYTCPVSPGSQSFTSTHNHARSDKSDNPPSDILISPNPAHDIIRIENLLIDENTVINIYNYSGQNVQEIPSYKLEAENSIDISNLKSGIYFISVLSNTERKTIKFAKI